MTSPALTQLGIILGTAAYMSPEQARGRPVDKRSDIWAFGAVLYEMLTGKRAFDGDDISYTLANILKSEPDWTALPKDTPPAVGRVLRRCLEKDPKRRTHDICDARLDLEEKDLAVVAMPVVARPRLLNLERVAWALLVASLAGALAYSLGRKPAAPPVVRFRIDPPVNGYFGSSTGAGQADGTSGGSLSPDGTLFAFVATERPDRTQLWLRRLDSFTARPLPGTANALLPFWSPDSRWLGFFADGKVKRIDTVDGSIQTIADAPGLPRGGAWGSRDVIVFGSGTPSKLARVSSRGGEVTVLDIGYGRWPFFLPDGRHFLYTGLSTGSSSLGILVGSIDAPSGPGIEPRSLVAAESNGAFAPPDVLLFMRGERLMQQRFDPDRLEVSGEATPVAEQVFYNPGVARGDFSVSATGVLAYQSGTYRSSQFAWFDRTGKMLETVGAPGNYRTADLSPDGQRLAYADVNLRDIWILDLSRQTASRFTSDPGTETAPVWFPDGNKIAYRSDFGGLFEKDLAGSGTGRLLLKASGVNGPDQVSSDGKWILYFPRHARRQPGRVHAADVGRSKTSGDRADAVSGRGAAVLSRCALARVCFERKRPERGVRPGFPLDRPAVAGVQRRRPPAAVAGRRQGTVLCQRREEVLCGRRVGEGRYLPVRRAEVSLRHARQRLQHTEQLYPQSGRHAFPREHAAGCRRCADQHRPELAGHRPVVTTTVPRWRRSARFCKRGRLR